MPLRYYYSDTYKSTYMVKKYKKKEKTIDDFEKTSERLREIMSDGNLS